ncbi:MAG: outer membrane beta-barrel protein [Bacteroidia bacterium]|nr:outer membrane beta-barrel protein [Bacteroidia bacterium]
MKHSLFLLYFVVIPYLLVAQEKLIDVLYLKNGSIVRGVIVEQIPGKLVKIQQKDGNFLIFNYDEIDKIIKESEKGISHNTTLVITDSIKAKNFFTAPFIGFNSLTITSSRVDNQFCYDLGFMMGYRFHTHWSIQSGLVASNAAERFERGQYRFILVQPPPIDSTYTLILEKYQFKKNYTFLTFPLLFRYHSERRDNKVGFFLDLGMRWGILFYKEKEYHDNLIMRDSQNTGFYWEFIILSLGLKVPILRELGFFIGPHYSVGMGKIMSNFEITQNLGAKLGMIYFF